MTRPAFIIGLGGTGQWILTYLKKELLESNHWYMPENVKLLSIDTQTQDVKMVSANAGAMEKDDRARNLTDARIGDLRLDKEAEFFQIGSPMADLVRLIAQDQKKSDDRKFKHFDWLDADWLLDKGDLTLNTTFGAGAFRQLGRLSLFKSADQLYSKILAALTSLSSKLTAGNDNQQRLEIHIAASIAGGTGAGTLIDTAWLIHRAAKNINLRNYVIRAFIVLPTAFEGTGPHAQKRKTAHAAWREIDRFMLGGGGEIVYNPNSNPPLVADCSDRIFTTTYMIDKNRAVNPLSSEPDTSVYPAVSQMISFLLDEHSGTHYDFAFQNYEAKKEVDRKYSGVYHCSFGCYTIKVPVYSSRDHYSRELALGALEKFIQPQLNDHGDSVGLRADRNRENAGTVNALVSEFLKSDNQGTVPNAKFLQHIDIVNNLAEAGTGSLLAYTKREAGFIMRRTGDTFNNYLTKLPQTGEDDTLLVEVRKIQQERVWDRCKASRDNNNTTPAINLKTLIPNVNNLEVEWFGQTGFMPDPNNPEKQILKRVNDGTRTVILREVQKRHVSTFTHLLQAWSARHLNGINAIATIAKGGKIGFLKNAMQNLNKRLDGYTSYLKSLRIEINQMGIKSSKENALRDQRIGAEAYYRRNAHRTCVFAFFDRNVHPAARDAERRYLTAADNLYAVYLGEQMIDQIESAIIEMKKFTQSSIQELEKWEKLLATGHKANDPSNSYESLYNTMQNRVRLGANSLAEEAKQGSPLERFKPSDSLAGVQQLIVTNDFTMTCYQNNSRHGDPSARVKEFNDAPEIDGIIQNIRWEISEEPMGLGFKCGFAEKDQVNFFPGNATQENVNKILDIWLLKAKSHFDAFGADHRADIDIPLTYGASDLADKISECVSPLYAESVSSAGALFSSLHIRVDDTRNKSYFEDMLERFKKTKNHIWHDINPLDNEKADTRSDDPFKLTVIGCGHFMPSSDFALHSEMTDAFNQSYIDKREADPINYFNFPAERNSLIFAKKRVDILKEKFKPFDIEVVSLLEDEDKARLFFYAFAHNLVKRKAGHTKGSADWMCKDIYLYESGTDGVIDTKRLPTMFEIVRMFLNGGDPNRVDRINHRELSKEILNIEKTNKAKAIKAYEAAAKSDGAGSIAGIIKEDRSIQQEFMAKTISYNWDCYQDLIDLARIIYQERVKKLS